MRFHPFRAPAPQMRTDCPFCSGHAAKDGRPCNICRSAGLGVRE